MWCSVLPRDHFQKAMSFNAEFVIAVLAFFLILAIIIILIQLNAIKFLKFKLENHLSSVQFRREK